eukprot:3361611-Pyramimonas_sp.AAC.1
MPSRRAAPPRGRDLPRAASPRGGGEAALRKVARGSPPGPGTRRCGILFPYIQSGGLFFLLTPRAGTLHPPAVVIIIIIITIIIIIIIIII